MTSNNLIVLGLSKAVCRVSSEIFLHKKSLEGSFEAGKAVLQRHIINCVASKGTLRSVRRLKSLNASAQSEHTESCIPS